MSSSSSSNRDVARVTIPIKVQKAIKDIKEIASNHSEEDIYAMLKECNMDPNETAQKLLYLDTFHEVKRKRDRKKPNVAVHVSQQNRWTPGMQRHRGGSQGRNSSICVSDDTGGNQHICSGFETGSSNHMESSSNHFVPVQKKNGSSHATISPNPAWTESNSKLSVDNFTDGNEGTVAVHACMSGKRISFPTVEVKELQALNPDPDSNPSPDSGASFKGRDSGVYSSASDPVLVLVPNPQNPGIAGAIKHEKASGMSLLESRLDAGQDVPNNEEDQRTMISLNKTSQGGGKNQSSESSSPSPFLNHANSFAPVSNQDSWPAEQVNGATKLMASGIETVPLQVKSVQLLPKVNDAGLEQSTLPLDKKLAKRNSFSYQTVIFPDHIQVTEAFRNGLTFGSLDNILDYTKSDAKQSEEVERTVIIDDGASREPSLSHQTTSSVAHESDFSVHLESCPHVPENSPLEVNISSAAPTKSDQSKPELVLPPGALQYPFFHTAPNYSFGFMPPVMGRHFVQVEAAEVGNSSTLGSSQPPAQTVGVGQNSVPVTTQFYPFLRQPYPCNYIPYNPYFPQFYIPHNATQCFGHGGFPQQASFGNFYLSPPAGAAGVKFPIPSMYKAGTLAPNHTHFGFPFTFGSFVSSAVGYGNSATVAPSTSVSNDDLPVPELKEKTLHSTVKQEEDSHAPEQDLSSLPANLFYNFPQNEGHPVITFLPGQGAFCEIYPLNVATAPPSIVQSVPQHSQATSPAVESVVPPPPSSTNPQPHSQLCWNPE